MKYSFSQCPACNSKNIDLCEAGYLYNMKPFKCLECGSDFEKSEQLRFAVNYFMWGLFILSYSSSSLSKLLGDSFYTIVGILFFIVSWGYIIYVALNKQYAVWSSNSLRRKVINYGSELSFVVLGVIFIYAET